MRKKIFIVTLMLFSSSSFAQDSLSTAIEGIEHNGEIRLGAIRTKDSEDKKATTVSLGGKLSIETKPISGISLVGTFFTTNHLFGKDDESLFLSSTGEDYSIVGEAYLKVNFGKSTIKAGRQVIDTPFADSDDIAMVPNSFEGYSLVNKDLQDSTVVLALLDKWSGVDAPIPEKFTPLQSSNDSVFVAGLIYEGVANTTIEAWHYELEDIDLNYGEFSYEKNSFRLGFQYTDQDNDNSAYGLLVGGDFGNLSLEFDYNKVDGIVTNGFGGGPFFTSNEDHTIADITDQEAKTYRAEYKLDGLTLGISHADFDKCENETDYLASFEVNKNHTIDLIYSDMYDDGNMVRFFANYKF